MDDPIKRTVLLNKIEDDKEDLSEYLEEVILEMEKEEKENNKMINPEMFFVSGLGVITLYSLKLDLVDMLLVVSLILLIVAVLTRSNRNEYKEESEM